MVASKKEDVHLIVKGTHVVYNTYNEKEPWLNLREKSNLKSKVIRQLSDGTELKLVEGPTWMYVYVLGQEDYIEKGHVSKNTFANFHSHYGQSPLPQ